jgi:hypothetical protein
MMLGAMEAGTGIHMDWGNGINLALALDGSFGTLVGGYDHLMMGMKSSLVS